MSQNDVIKLDKHLTGKIEISLILHSLVQTAKEIWVQGKATHAQNSWRQPPYGQQHK